MAETPQLPLPQDPGEQAVLDRLLEIREELTLLKQDKSTYIKSSDVMALYEKTVDQIRQLNEIRVIKPKQETRGRFLSNCLSQSNSIPDMQLNRYIANTANSG